MIFFSFLPTRRLLSPRLHMISDWTGWSSVTLAAELLAVDRAYPEDDEDGAN